MKKLIIFLLMILSLTSFAKDCFKTRSKIGDEEFEVKLTRYQREQETDKDILIIPPTGGINVLDRSYGRIFCSHGFNVTIIETFTDEDEYDLDLDIHRRYYARAQRAINLALKTIPEGNFIGIFGTSVGAFHTAIAVGTIPRIKAAFVVAGGADIASIIVDSDQNAMKVAREKRMEIYDFKTRDDYYNALSDAIVLEPMKYNYEGKDLGMMLALGDTTVPVRNQELLKDLWKPKSFLEFYGNHFITIVRTWMFNSGTILDFYEESARNFLKK